MNSIFSRQATLIWVILVVATLASYGAAGVQTAGGIAFGAVMLVAVGKAYLIARYFMELATANLPWRMIFGGLIIAGGVIITALHFLT